ncbi:cytochrome P450 [Nocardia nepalensis]|uniref:cytochrome P450 n=1 Tax=Nocardia nepalensis TaxID=3375448 RepID=UPI003B6748E3
MSSPATAPLTSPLRLSKLPPGPRGLPVVGVAPMLAADFWEYPRRVAAEYGDIAQLPMPTKRKFFLISHPDLVAKVFVRDAGNHWKGDMLRTIKEGLPASPMPTSDGEEWQRVRRLAQPHFTLRGMKHLAGLIEETVQSHVDALDRYAATGQVVDMETLLSTMSMDVLMRAMFTRERSHDELVRVGKDYQSFAIGGGLGWALFWVPERIRHLVTVKADAARERLLAFIREMIAERQADPIDSPDVLNALMNSRFDDGSTLTDDELTAELFGLIFAGFETTSAALAWTLAFLSANPAARAAAEAEAEALGRVPKFDDAAKLTYLRACFDEAQRIQGIPFYSRDSYEDQELGGYTIPGGSTLLCSPYALQHDSRFWREPDKFLPERFLEDEIEKNAWLPFGTGPRRCMGMHLANTEAGLFLGYALQKYRFVTVEGFEPKRFFHMSTSLKGGCPVRIERRTT